MSAEIHDKHELHARRVLHAARYVRSAEGYTRPLRREKVVRTLAAALRRYESRRILSDEKEPNR